MNDHERMRAFLVGVDSASVGFAMRVLLTLIIGKLTDIRRVHARFMSMPANVIGTTTIMMSIGMMAVLTTLTSTIVQVINTSPTHGRVHHNSDQAHRDEEDTIQLPP